jgi:hypothetical protein
MKRIDICIELGKTKEDGNFIYGSDELTEEQINKVIDRVTHEPDFRRGKLDTEIHINEGKNENDIDVTLGLFDVWGGEGNEEGDIWGNSPTYHYSIVDGEICKVREMVNC